MRLVTSVSAVVILIGALAGAVPASKLGGLPVEARDHWSFRPVVRPMVPSVSDARWAHNPIDAFVAARHETLGLTPRPEAAKHVLLRRVYLDLIGLPPSRAELHAFLADPSPDAYEKVIDRLLASPHYGERWGRHWMDVWRYSDWAGYQAEVRESQPHVWRWRDWIIESLNADKPYDQMVREMLAGDELSPGDPNVLRATGFLARNWYKFNRNVWLENTVEHTSKAFLGLTINCARCHDHLYDPISQKEHYRFRAFFEPYQVRTDRLPGEADTTKAGVVRAFDADAGAKTFLFVRGDEKQPIETEPLAPGVPDALRGDAGEVRVEPVSLPAEAYYPALQPWFREEASVATSTAVTKAENAVTEADQTVAPAQKQLDEAVSRASQPQAEFDRVRVNPLPSDAKLVEKIEGTPALQGKPATAAEAFAAARVALEKAQDAATLARLKLAAARSERVAVEAKLAADAARFATPQAANAPLLAAAAGRAEREAAVWRLEATVLGAGDATTDEAKKAREESKKKLDEARAKLREPATDYTPLAPAHPATSTGRRLALAKWITHPGNPLAARVAVNHIWARHFGEGLVPTVFDFGANGKPPTHPALIDWLAAELRDNNWAMKRVHRLIVTSATYRMDSADGPASDQNRATDPDNHFLWRAPVRRMEAELVRDSLLHVAGKLDMTTGGTELDEAAGLTTNRRSIYYRHAHEKQMTLLRLFDAASPNECYRRQHSVIPQQALALANSPLATAQARALAEQLRGDGDFVRAAYEQVLCRQPTADEREACESFLEQQATLLAEPAKLQVFAGGEAPAVPASNDPVQRARGNLVHVLLNHNDFVTIR